MHWRRARHRAGAGAHLTRRLLAAALIPFAPLAVAPVDPQVAKEPSSHAPGAGDQLLPRYAGSFILAPTKKGFDELSLPFGPGTGSSDQTDAGKKPRYSKAQTVEGRLTRTVRVIPEGRATLEVVRNYANELEGKGIKTLFQCSRTECGEELHKLHGCRAR